MIAPKFAWNTNYKRIFLLICISAIAGVLTVRFIPLSKAFQAVFAFAISQLIFINSGTSFAPMISAMVLPVLLQTSSIVYILTAISFTLFILLIRYLFEKLRISEKVIFKPAPPADKNTYLLSIIRMILGGIVLTAAVCTGHQFIAAPPFLVAFTEMSKPGSRAINMPFKTFLIFSVCGITGAAVRYIFTIKLAVFPLKVSALITTIIILLVMKKTEAFIPPAGAIGILAMLIPAEKAVYFPIECIIGSFAVIFLSNFFVYVSEKINLSFK